MIKIKPATTKADYICISKLAHTIWHEHYIKIISLEQIEYMLEKYNSVKSIEERVKAGVKFYWLTYNDEPVGYTAIENKSDYLYISKLYILKGYRGKKIAKTVMLYIESMAKAQKISIIKLNVNKYNTNSMLAYEKMGFVKTASTVEDIGNGFVMDDYEMEKQI
ncbi:GNAT family N-acetyltransferase [Thalassobellus suaedae]|uniref:GNAT family N-acetyltransferase n=1 Tax=Thalassobellus suaedae TaxID=3074124 RepID=A0ABY9XVI1_9FLAO|nr:GNAT family N-acetyltransferase [Flavobacteriaceae bacterium HL-DH14]